MFIQYLWDAKATKVSNALVLWFLYGPQFFPGPSACKTIGKYALWDCEQHLQQAHLTVALWEPNQSHSSPPLLWKCSSSFFLRERMLKHVELRTANIQSFAMFHCFSAKTYGPKHCIPKCLKFKSTKLRKQKVQNVNPTSTCNNNWAVNKPFKNQQGQECTQMACFNFLLSQSHTAPSSCLDESMRNSKKSRPSWNWDHLSNKACQVGNA